MLQHCTQLKGSFPVLQHNHSTQLQCIAALHLRLHSGERAAASGGRLSREDGLSRSSDCQQGSNNSSTTFKVG